MECSRTSQRHRNQGSQHRQELTEHDQHAEDEFFSSPARSTSNILSLSLRPLSPAASPTGHRRLRHRKAKSRRCMLRLLIAISILCAAGPSLLFIYQLQSSLTSNRHAVERLANSDQTVLDATVSAVDFADQLRVGHEERSLSIQKNVEPPKPQSAVANRTTYNDEPMMPQQQQQQLIIPNVVIFTHYRNLLEANLTALTESDELVVLQQNVRRIIQLHPTAQVRFLTDDDCRQSIANMFQDDLTNSMHETSDTNKTASLSLVDYFNNEPHGMYKADLCRGAALWETGGLYFDVDLGVRMNVFEALQQSREAALPPTSFVTIRVHAQSHRPGAFFQAFIGVTPKHAIMKRYVQLFLQYYQGKLPEYHGEPLGVVLLKRAMDDVLDQIPAAAETIELWQEVLYRSELKRYLAKKVPYPTWGTRRACKFIVLTDTKTPFTVPFYSRIAGSRMCPGTNATGEMSTAKRKVKRRN